MRSFLHLIGLSLVCLLVAALIVGGGLALDSVLADPQPIRTARSEGSDADVAGQQQPEVRIVITGETVEHRLCRLHAEGVPEGSLILWTYPKTLDGVEVGERLYLVGWPGEYQVDLAVIPPGAQAGEVLRHSTTLTIAPAREP